MGFLDIYGGADEKYMDKLLQTPTKHDAPLGAMLGFYIHGPYMYYVTNGLYKWSDYAKVVATSSNEDSNSFASIVDKTFSSLNASHIFTATHFNPGPAEYFRAYFQNGCGDEGCPAGAEHKDQILELQGHIHTNRDNG